MLELRHGSISRVWKLLKGLGMREGVNRVLSTTAENSEGEVDKSRCMITHWYPFVNRL
jgi:hypothetical protein